MRGDLRQIARKRYEYRCGYCGVRESDVGAELTIDHFQPRSQGGGDDIENLVYCCHACNTFKGDYWKPDAEKRLMHPKHDRLDEHLGFDESGHVRARTPSGEFHIQRLRLNRPALVAYRYEQRLLEIGRIKQKRILRHLAQLEQRVESLQIEIDKLTMDVDEERR